MPLLCIIVKDGVIMTAAAEQPILPSVSGIALAHLRRNLPIYVFVSAYFLTAVLANLLFITPIGADWPDQLIADFDWSAYDKPGFWFLLLFPLVLVPALALLSQRVFRWPTNLLSGFVADFSKPAYIVLCGAMYAYVAYSLYSADALALLISGDDAIGAVKARFSILAVLGYWPMMVMLSPLVFMAVYSAVSFSRQGGWFWGFVAAWNVVALSWCLILLNMKWPVVLFIATLGLAVLVASKRFTIVKGAAIMIAGAAVYLIISVVLLRLVPLPAEAPSQPIVSRPSDTVQQKAEYAAEIIDKAKSSSLIARGLSRMAVPVPYYYEVFTENGPVCGTLWDRLLRLTNPCQPSTYVYEQMYGRDGFEGQATAVAAVHIYGYALGGWPISLLELVLASIVIGAFLALWPATQNSAMLTTVFVMGGYTSYFWTQLPFEAALIYPHGAAWWALLVAACSIPSLAKRLLTGRRAMPSRQQQRRHESIA
jgi:hypothetical protein